MRDRFLQTIWRDVAPVVALVLALLLTFLTRHSDSVEYLNMQPSAYYQSQLWGRGWGSGVCVVGKSQPMTFRSLGWVSGAAKVPAAVPFAQPVASLSNRRSL